MDRTAHWLEILATAFGLLQGLLALLNKRCSWIAYVLQMLCLVLFSHHARLYGDVINSLFYIAFGFFGFFLWGSHDTKVSSCNPLERMLYSCLIVIGGLLAAFVLQKTADALPILDAFTTVSSFAATYYMARHKTDTWLIWFINDILYIIEYLLLPQKALYLLCLNIIWAVMAVISWFSWKRIEREERTKDVS